MQANIGFAIPWPSFAVTHAGELGHLGGFCAQTRFAADDFPAQSRLLLAGAPMTAAPLAFAPVAMTSPDGWTEWNQPPGWRDHGWSYLGQAGAANDGAANDAAAQGGGQ